MRAASTRISRSAARRDRSAMCSAVVGRRDLHVDVVLTPIDVPVLDAAVWEVHLPVEVRQDVLVRPFLDFAGVTVRPSRSVRSVPVALVEPLLVLALQL